jgi:hypothetical protein
LHAGAHTDKVNGKADNIVHILDLLETEPGPTKDAPFDGVCRNARLGEVHHQPQSPQEQHTGGDDGHEDFKEVNGTSNELGVVDPDVDEEGVDDQKAKSPANADEATK